MKTLPMHQDAVLIALNVRTMRNARDVWDAWAMWNARIVWSAREAWAAWTVGVVRDVLEQELSQ